MTNCVFGIGVLGVGILLGASVAAQAPKAASPGFTSVVSSIAANSGWSSLSDAIANGSVTIAVGPTGGARAYGDYFLGGPPTPQYPATIVVQPGVSPAQGAMLAIHEFQHMLEPQTPTPGDNASKEEWQAYFCVEMNLHCSILLAIDNYFLETMCKVSCAFKDMVLNDLIGATYLCFPLQPIVPSCPGLDINNIPCH